MNPNTPNIARPVQYVFAIAIAVLLASVVDAQSQTREYGAIEGTVTNVAEQLPMAAAKVTLPELQMETLTDGQGHFLLSRVPPGEHRIEVHYLGFDPQRATTRVQPGQASHLDIQLALQGSPASTVRPRDAADVVKLDRFTVVSDRLMSAQALAINEQRNAANIKNVVAFEELGEQGMENIGNYIRFLPGVVIMEDGDNPGSVALGGFPDNMTNVMLDGGEIANTGTGASSSRTVSIRDVPMVNVERIEVSKVPTPDMPASGLGGSVNIITRSLLGTRKPLFTYQGYMNFNDRDGISLDGGPRQATKPASPKHMQPSYNATLVFPVGKRLAFSVGGSRTWTRRATDDTPTESANWNLLAQLPGSTVTRDLAIIEALWSQKADIATTNNLQASGEVKISDRDTLTLGVQRRWTSNKTGENYIASRYGTGTSDGTYVQSGAMAGSMDMSSRNNLQLWSDTTHLTGQYRHRGQDWRIEAKGSYSRAKRITDGNGNGYFASVSASTPKLNLLGEGINQTGSILPTTFTATDRNGAPLDFNALDGDDYDLKTASQTYGRYNTDLMSGSIAVERSLGRHLSVRGGVAYNRMNKDDHRSNLNYTFRGDSRGSSVSAYDLVDDSIEVTMNGRPVRWISPVKAYQLFLDEPQLFTLNPSAYSQEAQNSKRMLEDIMAGFLRFDLKLLRNRLNITTGVRYEKTGLDGWSMKRDDGAVYQRDANGDFVRDAKGKLILITTDATEKAKLTYQERGLHEQQDYDGFYPSINANYTLTENVILRAAYARTIGRPDVSYVVAGIILPNPSTKDPEAARTITVGNPGLEPWTANSFHLSIDAYNAKGGYGSLGVYRKYVSNFFANRVFPANDEILESFSIGAEDREMMLNRNYQIRRWENVGDAHLTGAELSLRQTIPFLPTWLQEMQAWLNYTHLAVGGANAPDFIGFTPDVLSGGLNYIRPRFALHLAAAYQGETKVSLDYNAATSAATRYPPDTYTYQGAYTKYSVTAEYAFSKSFSLFANWDNVFSKDRIYYRRGPDTPAYAAKSRRYVNPSTIMIGVKGQF